ncbi:MAG: hypothetical protein ACI8Z1_002000, partial [Candidatus Azotimanducaceae bacterium]
MYIRAEKPGDNNRIKNLAISLVFNHRTQSPIGRLLMANKNPFVFS